MKTNTVYGWELDNNDVLPATDDRPQTYVYMREDEGDFITLTLVDEDAEHYTLKVAPFDSVTIVESFEDEDKDDLQDAF